MATNTNPHSPGNVDPAHYDYIGNFYRGSSQAMEEAYLADHKELADRLGSDWDDRTEYHANGGCASCGASFAHGALVRHIPTGQLVAVGHTCGQVFERIAQKLQARVLFAEQIERTPGLGWALAQDHRILREMAKRDRPLSDRQVEFAWSLAEQVITEEWERATSPETAPLADVPVPEFDGRVEVAGEVLAVKWQESDYGGSLKMLVEVEHDGGAYRLWVSVPSSIGPENGDRVAFTAKVERSARDESFGFFKRPTKATIIEGSK